MKTNASPLDELRPHRGAGFRAERMQRRRFALPTVAATSSAERALVDEVASALQACSYDGTPVRIAGVGGAAPSDCRDMVAQIMRYTGLPQNFTVVEAPVPNAAAVILLDDQRIPQRVIAFNKDFMGIVRSATAAMPGADQHHGA